MSWTVSDEEFRSVLALAPPRHYEYFIKRVASHGAIWGLRDASGWVIAEDDDGARHFPVWPHPRYAAHCAASAWEAATPAPIDVDDWVEAWMPKLQDDGLRIAVFQTGDDRGVGVSSARLKHDLEEELRQFGLGE
jgi:hypothetical protein